ncbi:voltage-dependent T-type calcium channel subunit alpha-1G isoform X5 [Lucilia sericata]|uniref:voltage-dependent T-type calcium channel subunit alpha-1G isoform X5 n=1 Tax=Lucilia sericata TaxID=13632 RepID=UPI0018A835BB|nr:voltage-dependent T-type calcium channel subunit alpha-1G isoform X5 [Lucilia sericata]
MLHSSVQEQNQHGNNNNNHNNNNNNHNHTTTTTPSMTSANSTNLNANAEGTKTSNQAIEIRSLAASQLEQQHNGQKSHKQHNTDNDSLAGADRARSSSINAATRARLRETSSSTGSTNSNIMHSNEDSGIEARHRRCGSSSSGGGGTGNNGSRSSHRHRKTSSSSAKASTGNVGSNVGAGSSTAAAAASPKNPYTNTSDMTAAPKTGDASSSTNIQQQPPTTASQRNLQSHQQNSNTIKNRSSSNLKKNARERSDDERVSIANESTEETTRHRRRRSRRISKNTTATSSSSSSSSTSSGSSTGSSCNGSCSSDDGDSSTSSGEPNLPYPGFPEVALKYFSQDTTPRNWCLMLITNPWFERISILVILLNCITLGMYQPCVDDACEFNRCKILQIFDDIIFIFFAVEMIIKMVAMGIYGKNTYLADSWNRLDFFIVFAGLLEYVVHVKNLNLTAIRTIRVLRPLRAINRIPSMRILVMLLLDTLPMLGNVLLLCFFVFFIFGIIGVQLWQGILRQRCVLEVPEDIRVPLRELPDEYRVRVRVNSVSYYYEFSKEQDYICSMPEDSGMHMCSNLPPYRNGPMVCTEAAIPNSNNLPTNTSCVDWNIYYSVCRQTGQNPFQGTISFDNIGMAWVAIFLVISLEGWTDIMYYVQDAHSFWDWIYFVLLIVIGSFFMINLCLVVIATQFSETKKREMERMRQERARYTSTSTLASSTNNSEPATCYAEIVKYIAHLWRRFKRRMLKKYRLYKYQQKQRKEGLLPNADNLTFSPSRIKSHHPKCPKYASNRKPSSIQDQMITVMVPLNSNNNISASGNNNNHTHVQQHQQTQQQNQQQLGAQQQHSTTQTPSGMVSLINGLHNGNNSHINTQTAQSHQHHSSSENSEQSLENVGGTVATRNSNYKKISNQLKPEADNKQQQKTILLKFPQNLMETDQLILQLGTLGKTHPCTSGFLSPPTSASRRPSVMFNEYVLLHTPPALKEPQSSVEKTVCSSEKMTQAGDGSIWQVNLPQTLASITNPYAECSDLGIHDAMTCQELLAFSVAFSAALPTGQSTLESFYSSLARCDPHTAEAIRNQQNIENSNNLALQQHNQLQQQQQLQQQKHFSEQGKKPFDALNSNGGGAVCGNAPPASTGNCMEDYSCCYDLYQNALSPLDDKRKKRSRLMKIIIAAYRCIMRVCGTGRRYIKRLVEHKYFQQGILLAILINTLSMGIEYHKQPEELTVIVETSNIVFSAIFAVEMLLKVVAEGPFRYIANGFNVFDGVIVILSAIEICQQFAGNGTGGGGGSGLSVLRTFRLLRILKLVRFMPNLRRQLFVMLRTMDNVAVFFSLLVLFIFIFSILGMNLFGCKFCEKVGDEVVCDRKNFDSLLWALVTVFQILTQEDWNVVLFNGMEKTSHWAALYFVALMTFGNYVLFNLLVAILVEGFSSERNERREREQRELVKKLREETLAENYSDAMYDESHSEVDSSSTNESYYEVRNRWHSAEDIRKEAAEMFLESKNNMQKQRLQQPASRDHQIKEVSSSASTNNPLSSNNRKSSEKDLHKPTALGSVGVGAASGVPISSSIISDEDRRGLKKTYSIRDRRADVPRLAKIRPIREPPIITTTAATPQDSPNTTLETGTTFRNWGPPDSDSTESPVSPSLLRPPTIFSAQRSLDEGIPSIDLIPPSPVLPHKQHINILNASQLESNTNNSLNNFGQAGANTSLLSSSLNGSGGMQSVIIDDISKNSNSASGPIYVPTISSTAAKLQLPTYAHTRGESSSSTGPAVLSTQASTLSSNAQESAEPLQRLPSLKRFRRSSSKRKKADILTAEDVEHQLNNGSDNSCLLTDSPSVRAEAFLKPSTPNLSVKSKETNRLSPQNSIRRLSTSLSIGSGPGSRRASACLFNSHMYQNLNQPSKLHSAPGKRRMSSIELAFTKTSHLNLHNLEPSRKSLSYTNSKLDLDKWQKNYACVGETDMLQQYMQERERRKNSISQYPKKIIEETKDQQHSTVSHSERMSKIKILIERLAPHDFTNERRTYSLYIFPENNRFRRICIWFVNQKWFDNVVLLFIALNCITLAMERPNIPPYSTERLFLSTANYVFTAVFTLEMIIKVVATGMFYGPDAYFTSGWNIMDGSLVTISIIDLLMSLISQSSPRIFGILRVFRLLRSLRPLRVINRAPGLKLVVQTLLSSLRPIGNIVLICCTFFIIFGILGVQLFKGTFYFCEGENIKNVRNMSDCLSIPGNAWVNRKYNFDDLGKALMSLFVLSSRDGWVNIMYTGLDAVGIDQQPIVNYNEWRLLYFIAFILLVGFFVLNMFVGVVVENFHRCREEQEKEEKIRRAAKRALQMEKKRRRMHEPPYYINYSPSRMFVHNVVTSKYFDLAIAAVIGLNVVTMAMEYHRMRAELQYALKIFNYFFTAVFILEANMKLVALGWHLYLKDKWNQLDVSIVLLSIVGIVLEELNTKKLPINPTIMRVMRVLRIARVLKLLKMAKGIRALLDTVMQALPQVGNLGLLFFLLFFIFAALGVELFGRLECSEEIPCQGLGEHAHFANFGMAFLTLFRVATGDNWNGIMKDTLRNNCDDAPDCVRNCCVSSVIAPIFFVIFVLMAQFVLVNVVVAVLMKHLEESHKQMEDEMDMEVELERELVREQEFEQEQKLCEQLQQQTKPPAPAQRQLGKVKSLPMNFTYNTPSLEKKFTGVLNATSNRRQTVQYFNQQNGLGLAEMGGAFKTQALTQLIPESATTEENSFDSKLQIPPTARRGRRCSTALRKRGTLTKERSLDEQAIRRRTLESKRMSSDSLPWGGDVVDFRSGTIFESLESDGSPSSTYDVHSIRSEEVPRSVSDVASIVSAVVSEKPPSAATSSATTTRRPYGRSLSTDPTFMGPARTNLLSVPRSMPPRSRSGSTKQLFKQQALDEDPDMDESSLLLPVVMESGTDANTTAQNENKASNDANGRLSADIAIVEGLSKSDSAEILRIISERRRMDQRDNSGNEDSDYNELLLVKSPQSSIDG